MPFVAALRRTRSSGLLVLPLLACAGPAPGDQAVEPPRPAPTLETGSPRTEQDAEAHVLAEPQPAVVAADDGSSAAPEETIASGAPGSAFPAYAELGFVAGAPITSEDLLLGWYEVSGREVWLIVEKLVAVRLAFAEAQRLGIRLTPAAVELRVDAGRADLAREAEEAGFVVDDYVRSRLGVEPAIYYDRLRLATIRQMLAERAVRSFTLGSDSVDVRLIVVPAPEQMAGIKAELLAGADFEELARRHSVDESAERGGLVNYIVRQEGAPLARLAFTTPVGEIGGPIESADHQFLLRVENRRAPLPGDWRTIAVAVEQSLATTAVGDSEFLYWKLAMEDRYPIDLRPLKSMLGMER